ncbi:hypothetical protein BU17DRAFT_48583, partial [Hysterangium stoloniferum]
PEHFSTIAKHTGPVLKVRLAYSGKQLMSGSGDAIVVVWNLTRTSFSLSLMTSVTTLTIVRALKRLPIHESGHPSDDRYLASVGLDSMIIVWFGLSLYRSSHIIDILGRYTVKIWRTTDWELETSIDKPFGKSPISTFLSWSPDGAHITSPNVMNNKGAVFVAASLRDIRNSLVRHENTVEVAACNPYIFLRNPEAFEDP